MSFLKMRLSDLDELTEAAHSQQMRPHGPGFRIEDIPLQL